MESAVIYNLGRDAAKQGEKREIPETVNYPVYSKYRGETSEVAYLSSSFMQREWLRGYDSV